MNKLTKKPPAVLIVDDESDICYLLGNILKQKHMYTVFASSLSEADHLIEDFGRPFSIIFLDNYLPDGQGTDYIWEAKKKCPACKIVMITAHDNQADRDKARSEGADFFIGKPFSREIVLKTIDKLTT